MVSTVEMLGGLLLLVQGQNPGECHGFNQPRAALPTCTAADIRYGSAAQTITVSGEITCSLSQISPVVPPTALASVDGVPGGWLLSANLVLVKGAVLLLHGTAAHGDVDELRLLSTPTRYVSIKAEWGALDVQETRITSWDPPLNGPDLVHEDGRAFMAVHSFTEDDQPRTSRMDIRNSQVGYLGFEDEGAFGLSWRVDEGRATVLGLIHNSRVHHNYVGGHSWRASCMEWVGNEISHGIQHGLYLQDNSDQLLVSGNHVHHNGVHGMVASGNGDHLVIRNNATHHNGKHGIMLHDNTRVSVLQGNRSFTNQGSGIAVWGSHHNVIHGNDLYRNVQGILVSQDSAFNVIEHNVIHDNTEEAIRFSRQTRDNRVRFNTFFDNGSTGLEEEEAEAQDIDGNNSFRRVEGHDHAAETAEAP